MRRINVTPDELRAAVRDGLDPEKLRPGLLARFRAWRLERKRRRAIANIRRELDLGPEITDEEIEAGIVQAGEIARKAALTVSEAMRAFGALGRAMARAFSEAPQAPDDSPAGPFGGR